MNNKLYSPDQMADAVTMLDSIKSVPPERRFLVKMMMEAFASGMEARDKLAALAAGSGRGERAEVG